MDYTVYTTYNTPAIEFRSTSSMMQESHYHSGYQPLGAEKSWKTCTTYFTSTAKPTLCGERLYSSIAEVSGTGPGQRKAGPPSGGGGAGVDEPTLLPIGDALLPLLLAAVSYILYRSLLKKFRRA